MANVVIISLLIVRWLTLMCALASLIFMVAVQFLDVPLKVLFSIVNASYFRY